MRYRDYLLLTQLGILAAILLSAALLVDHLGATTAYCHVASGCAVARNAAVHWFGQIPLPLLGLLSFAGLLGATTQVQSSWGRRALLGGAILGGLLGGVLLAVQAFSLRTFCPYCVAVDLLAVVIAVLGSAWYWQGETSRTRHGLGLSEIGVYLAIAAVIPVVWPHFRPALPVPDGLVELRDPTKTNIVEFVDLECPHCRALYPTLEQLRLELGNGGHLLRLHAPFPGHQVARKAARLLNCLGPGEHAFALEEKLFLLSAITEFTLTKAAADVGITTQQLDACLNDPESEAALKRNWTLLERLGRTGLPLTFVEGERISGAMPLVVYRSAVERVRRSPSNARVQATAFFGIVFLLTLAIHWVLGPRNHDSSTASP